MESLFDIIQSQSNQGWGAKVIDLLSKDLNSTFPEMKGFSTRNLKYMPKFAEEYPNRQFVQQAAAQITWYHNLTILDKISDNQTRSFYIKKTIEYGWSRSVMVSQIETALPTIEALEAELAKNLIPERQFA